MIKNFVRGLAALSLSLTPLLALSPVQAVGPTETTTLADAVHRIPVADEHREGYTRTAFRHWSAGAVKSDGCNTRAEVLIAEAGEAPSVGARCKITGGEWLSYYDAQEVEDARALDVDHMVPLAEAWDSGASAWSPARREAYANDLAAPASLVAVTARTKRAKADQDPSQWLPPLPAAYCRYVSEWAATKLRWDLAADPAELDALAVFASGHCKDTPVTYTAAS
ncbi:HNH endonuclease family protein [Streptomyces sp. NBC_01283]|uniref:HNH endonuclease family protein n=1 Tax=Streptomyces sp. NBC_01283 TaxID=2903812 RepID=UPI00352EA83B|nr:HNH endonuclease family protein [Streptomyces sp. NBC_01283]WSL21311.1 HNH endonuclease family protein [Streptomyces sp. NBC_01283]